MIWWVLGGVLIGFLIFLAAILSMLKFVIIAVALFMVISPFVTSGKGDRDYTWRE